MASRGGACAASFWGRPWLALVFGAAFMGLGAVAAAQESHVPSAAQKAVLGDWSGQRGSETIRMTLRIDPETVDSVLGTYRAGDGPEIQLAGEFSDAGDALSMEESRDGRAVSGHWSGGLVRQAGVWHLKGSWSPAGDDDREVEFDLARAQPSRANPSAKVPDDPPSKAALSR